MSAFDEYREKVLAEGGEDDLKSTVLVPKCEVCGANMKTHGMFFDEAYSEKYYRYRTVKNFFEDADVMIVVGS